MKIADWWKEAEEASGMKIEFSEVAMKRLEEMSEEEREEVLKSFMESVKKGTLMEESEPVDLESMEEEERARFEEAMQSPTVKPS